MIPFSKIIDLISIILSKFGSFIISSGCHAIFPSNNVKTCEEEHGTIVLILISIFSLLLGYGMLTLRDIFFGCEIGETHHINMKQKYADMGEDNLASLRSQNNNND